MELLVATLAIALFISLGLVAYVIRQFMTQTRVDMLSIKELSQEAMRLFKASSLEEKVRVESLDRTLKKIEEVAPPTLTPTSSRPKSGSDMVKDLVQTGSVKTQDGETWDMM